MQNVLSLAEEAIKYDYKLLMIRANYIKNVKNLLKKTNTSTLVRTVISFPEGTKSVSEKLEEAKEAIRLEVDELDFVVNYTAFKKGNFSLIE